MLKGFPVKTGLGAQGAKSLSSLIRVGSQGAREYDFHQIKLFVPVGRMKPG